MWEEGMKDCINGPGHITKMAAMLICGKTFKNLLQNLNTWHEALMTLTYFAARSNLVSHAFI